VTGTGTAGRKNKKVVAAMETFVGTVSLDDEELK
jgi:hypothetical protein